MPAKPLGRTQKECDDDHGQMVHGRRTVAEKGVQKPKGVPNSVFDVARPPKQAAKPRRAPTRLDPDAVVIETDVPLPDRRSCNSNVAACRVILARLGVMQSVLLTAGQAKAMQKEAKAAGAKLRTHPDPKREGMQRVWLVQRAGAAS
jgi:hypothetical protein